MKQLKLLSQEKNAYGGELLKTRKGRQGPRPLAVRSSMHLTLRSSQARGQWSFLKPSNRREIERILKRFSHKYGVRLHSVANVGNHLHFHIQLTNRYTYSPFIRAISAAIAMAVTGVSRWSKTKRSYKKFWDYRPFTRVVIGSRAFLTLKDYVRINQLEGFGIHRERAEYLIKNKNEYTNSA